jgi:hypothetical protein
LALTTLFSQDVFIYKIKEAIQAKPNEIIKQKAAVSKSVLCVMVILCPKVVVGK